MAPGLCEWLRRIFLTELGERRQEKLEGVSTVYSPPPAASGQTLLPASLVGSEIGKSGLWAQSPWVMKSTGLSY